MTHSTYAPPVRLDQLPTTRGGWYRSAGLTDPDVIAAYVLRRSGGAPRGIGGSEPCYADFFHAD